MFRGKVVIVGAGFVGSTTAYTIMLSGLFSQSVIIDINKALLTYFVGLLCILQYTTPPRLKPTKKIKTPVEMHQTILFIFSPILICILIYFLFPLV